MNCGVPHAVEASDNLEFLEFHERQLDQEYTNTEYAPFRAKDMA